jgi:hypothetical protein
MNELPIALSVQLFVPDIVADTISTPYLGDIRRGLTTPEEVIYHNIERFSMGNNPGPFLLGQMGDTPCYLRLQDGLPPSTMDFKLHPDCDCYYYGVRRNGFDYDLYRFQYRRPSSQAEIIEWIEILIHEMGEPQRVEIPGSGYHIETEHLPRSSAEIDFFYTSPKLGRLHVQSAPYNTFWVMRV